MGTLEREGFPSRVACSLVGTLERDFRLEWRLVGTRERDFRLGWPGWIALAE